MKPKGGCWEAKIKGSVGNQRYGIDHAKGELKVILANYKEVM